MNTPVFRSPKISRNFIEGRVLKGIDIAVFPRKLVDTLYVWQRRGVDRKNLRAMSHHQLTDIGIDRADVLREAAKPFWKA